MWSTNSPVNNSAVESKALARARAKELSDSIRAKNLKSKAPTSTGSNGSTKVTNSPTINSNRGSSSIPASTAKSSSIPASTAKSSSIPASTAKSSSIPAPTAKSSSIPAPRLSSNTNSSAARSSSTLRSTNVGSTPLSTATSNTSRSADFSRSTRSSSAVPRRPSTSSSSSSSTAAIPFSNLQQTNATADSKLKSSSSTAAAVAAVSPQSSSSTSTATGVSKPSSRLSTSQRATSVGGGTRDNNKRTLVKEVFVEETSTYSINAVPTTTRDDQSITTVVSSIHSNNSSSIIIHGMSNKHQEESMMKYPISDLLEIDNHYTIELPRQPTPTTSTASLINASILAVPKKSDLEFLNQSILFGTAELMSEPKNKFLVPESIPGNNNSRISNNNDNVRSSSSLRSNNSASNNRSQHSSSDNNNNNDNDKNNNNSNNNNNNSNHRNIQVYSYPNKQEAAIAVAAEAVTTEAVATVVKDNKAQVTPHHHRPLSDMGTMTDDTTVIISPPPPTIVHTHNYNINTSPTHRDPPLHYNINTSSIHRDTLPTTSPPNITSLIQSMRSKTSLAPSPDVINGFNNTNYNNKSSSNQQTNTNFSSNNNYSNNNTTITANNNNMHSSSPSQVIHQHLATAQQLLEAILSPSVAYYSPTFDTSRTATTRASPVTSAASAMMMGKGGIDSHRAELAQYRISALSSKQLDNSERLIDGVSTPNTDISAISQSTSIVMPSSSLPEAVAFTHTNQQQQQHTHQVPLHGGHEIGQAELPKTGVVAARLRAIRERITSHDFHSPN